MNGIEDIYGENRVERNVDELVKEIWNNKFDHSKPLPPEPNYTIKIGGSGLCIEGASMCGIYGQPKSRKSSFMSMIAAAILSKEKAVEHITTSIEGSVIWIDTEQSEQEIDYFCHSILKLAGLDKEKDDKYIRENFHVLKLRPYDEEDRFRALDRLLMSKDIITNPGAIFLDGIADLTYNVNEIEASKKLVTRIMQWLDYLKVFGATTLHTNKDGKDATGALGGFLNKKATYTIKTENEYETGPSQIRTYYNRTGQKFEPFLINHNEETRTPQLYDPALDVEDLGPRNKQQHEEEVYEHDADRIDDGRDSQELEDDTSAIDEIYDKEEDISEGMDGITADFFNKTKSDGENTNNIS